MFGVDLELTLGRLYETALPVNERSFRWNYDHSITSRGILVELEFVVRDETNNKSYEEVEETAQRDWYYVIFCGNTSVFYVRNSDDEGNTRWWYNIPAEEWINTSNHDSCWRTDGLRWITTRYFEMCGECNPDVAPIALDTRATIGFVDLWKNVMVTTKPDAETNWKRRMVKIDPH